ncbi:jg8510 [Pararge aegeria aegeria]|uniref:Jg8510 protein n=2 Tax=Pararge aegeria TaxID=116150 RepID=A0A8S4R9Y9_9NEOP|nr:jg8510 [Pararge aegeria aegeria]
MVNLSLSGAQYRRYRRDRWNTYDDNSYDMPNTGHQGVNIGNGVNRKNVVIIENRNSDHRGNSQPGFTTNNIGNGMGNQNTVVIGNGDRRQHHSDSDSWKQGGTILHKGNNGFDVFNVGYGDGNQNRVTVDGKEIDPDCFGSSCDRKAPPRRISSAAGTNKAFSLFLTVLNIFFLNLIYP